MPVGRLAVQPADHLAAWLTFAGALIVATLAAVTAQIRLRSQLKAESERLTKQLDAEDKRHLDQLAFQRGETDRAELRSILDALAEHVFAMDDAVDNIVAAAAIVGSADDVVDDEEEWDDRMRPLSQRVRTEHDEVLRQTQRLTLRLGPEGELLVRTATMIRVLGGALGGQRPAGSTRCGPIAIVSRNSASGIRPKRSSTRTRSCTIRPTRTLGRDPPRRSEARRARSLAGERLSGLSFSLVVRPHYGGDLSHQRERDDDSAKTISAQPPIRTAPHK